VHWPPRFGKSLEAYYDAANTASSPASTSSATPRPAPASTLCCGGISALTWAVTRRLLRSGCTEGSTRASSTLPADRLDKMLKQYMAKLLRTLDPADLQPALKTLLDGMGRWTTRSTRAT